MDALDYLQSAMDVVDSQAPTVDRSKKGTPWLKSFSFEAPGTYPIRLISHPERCPKGFHPYCVHEVQKRPVPTGKISSEDKAKCYKQILCTLSINGVVPFVGEDGKKGSKLANPCPVCDVYTDIQQSFGEFDDDGKFTGIPEHVLEKGVQEALEDMRQGTCVKYLFPCLVRATCQTNEKTGYEEYVQGNDLFLALLSLQPGKYGGDKTLLTEIFKQVKAYPDLFSPDKGNWLEYRREKRNTILTAEDPSSLSSTERALFADNKYPNVVTYGHGVDGVPGSNKRMSYDQALYSFSDDWWMKTIKRKHPDYNHEAIERGLV